ncbi:hypothetical protein SKAU_G00340050 [Synaphobranchus kaupii]|uniref:Uncharacterized protein n=1 Tax=Synaphobranchus kaupii TaxID=118154 RepID=A0A9Q1IJF8_SYNKA|nr:hypothetical protein SKAU_G00340050 [Synaphobranchus kaupii]
MSQWQAAVRCSPGLAVAKIDNGANCVIEYPRVGPPMAPQNQGNQGNMSDVGPHCVLSQSPMPQERGFVPNMQRNPPMAQFGPQQSGPSMSPHPSQGGQMHHGMGTYQQSGSSGTYGPTGGQFGPQGNFPRPPSYDGGPGANYSGPGPGVTNNLGTNAGSPMQGQGPGMPLSHGRAYSGTVGPSSPSIPQSSGPSVTPSLANINRKPQEAAATIMQAAANTTQGSVMFVGRLSSGSDRKCSVEAEIRGLLNILFWHQSGRLCQ